MNIIKRLEADLREGLANGQRQNFLILPYLILNLEDRQAPESVTSFLASCVNEWPEFTYMGGVLKPVDKITTSQPGIPQPAFPIPPLPIDQSTVDTIVNPLFTNLLSKGVKEVVMTPNILPLIVDQNHLLLPKMEIRIIAFSDTA